MARLAALRVGRQPVFELSIINAAKPPLDFLEIDRRLAQFGDDQPLWLTRAATFAEKAQLFPQAVFVVGADTAARIADPKYFAGGAAGLAEAIGQIRAGLLAAGVRPAGRRQISDTGRSEPAPCPGRNLQRNGRRHFPRRRLVELAARTQSDPA